MSQTQPQKKKQVFQEEDDDGLFDKFNKQIKQVGQLIMKDDSKANDYRFVDRDPPKVDKFSDDFLSFDLLGVGSYK